MENAILITPKVISRIKGLSEEDQNMVLQTFISDEILNQRRSRKLTPIQELVYTFMRDYIMRDSRRYLQQQQHMAMPS